MSSKCKCHLYALPLIILLSLIFSHLAYVIGFCIILVNDLLESCLYILFLNVLVVLLLWSFLSSIFYRNATVPVKYKLTDHEMELLERSNDESKNLILEAIAAKRNLLIQTRYPPGQIRFCLKCKHIKPDRARHCSSCGKCVLKMDHHCPFVNNCVGFSNYKSFVLLQVYTLLYCLFIIATCVRYIGPIMDDKNPSVVVCFLLAALYGMFCGSLMIYHCALLRRNMTSIDQLKHPIFVVENSTFNLGCYKNFREVFGDKCLVWPFPVNTSLGEGDVFPIRIMRTPHSNV